MVRKEILETALKLTCGERNVSYGEPYINLTDIALLWTAFINMKYGGTIVDDRRFAFTSEDVAWMNVLTKIARSVKSLTTDNYNDAAAYAAIAGECRTIEELDE